MLINLTSESCLFPQAQFSTRIRVIARPADADTATLRGAARYGLARTPLVSSVIAPRSYLMKVACIFIFTLDMNLSLRWLSKGQVAS